MGGGGSEEEEEEEEEGGEHLDGGVSCGRNSRASGSRASGTRASGTGQEARARGTRACITIYCSSLLAESGRLCHRSSGQRQWSPGLQRRWRTKGDGVRDQLASFRTQLEWGREIAIRLPVWRVDRAVYTCISVVSRFHVSGVYFKARVEREINGKNYRQTPLSPRARQGTKCKAWDVSFFLTL